MADDAVGLLDALGIGSAHVVGASLGGFIAQTVAIRSPRRVPRPTVVITSTRARPLRPPPPAALPPPGPRRPPPRPARALAPPRASVPAVTFSG